MEADQAPGDHRRWPGVGRATRYPLRRDEAAAGVSFWQTFYNYLVAGNGICIKSMKRLASFVQNIISRIYYIIDAAKADTF